MSSPGHVLVTIGPSHFCEKARWALERAGIPYREDRHAPLFHLSATLPRKTRSTPLLLTPEGQVPDSTEILKYVDTKLPEARRLFPADPALAATVVELEDRFDEVIGPHVRRWVYAYLLEDAGLTRTAICDRLPRVERTLFQVAQPVFVGALRRSLRIDDAGRDRSLERIRGVLAETDARLADGRRYLVGDRFTAADLALAALMAPFLLAPGYGSWLPPIESCPPGMRSEIQRVSETPTGKLVLRLYREERRAPAVTGAAA